MNIRKILLLLTVYLVASTSAWADELVLSVGEVPIRTHYEFAKRMTEVYKAAGFGTMRMQEFPFPRSIANVVEGKADAHMPVVTPDFPTDEIKDFSFSSQEYAKVYYVIYSNKAHPLTIEQLMHADYILKKEDIENDPFQALQSQLTPLVGVKFNSRAKFRAALAEKLSVEDFRKLADTLTLKAYPFNIHGISMLTSSYYDFPVTMHATVEPPMQMVNRGRIDGYVMAQDDCDDVIRALKLNNIHRSPYKRYSVRFVIPAGEKGKKTDQLLSKILVEMKKRHKLVLTNNPDYVEWQPHD